MAVVETSVLQWPKKSRGWLHKWKLLEEVQTHQVSIWDTLDPWTYAHAPLTSKTKLLLRALLNEGFHMSNNLVWKHTTSKKKYVCFCHYLWAHCFNLLHWPACSHSSLSSRTSEHRLPFGATQYCMHFLGRHNNNLNPCLWPQFYAITEHEH